MSTFTALLLVIVIYFISAAIVGINDARANPTPQVISYQQLAQTTPKSGWYRITGCRMNLTHAVQDQQDNITIRAYVPVYSAFNPMQGPTHIVAQMDDRPTTVLFNTMDDLQKHSPGELQSFVQAHRSALLVNGDIQGLVTLGLHGNDVISSFGNALDRSPEETIMIKPGWEPSPATARVELGIGVAVALLFIVLLICDLRNLRNPIPVLS